MTDKHFMQTKAEDVIKKKKLESNAPETETAQFDQGPTSVAVQRALANPNSATLTPAVLTSLQRSHGNQFVAQLARQQGASKSKLSAPIQMKMSVTAADDHHEHEADAVAKNVINKISSGEVQREQEQAVQAKRLQREGDEEEMMMSRIQREEGMEEEEMMQGKRLQREGDEEEMMMSRIDRVEEEELMQGKRLQREGDEEEMMMKHIDRMEEDELQGKRIDRKSSMDGFDVSNDIEERVESSRGGGQAMDDTTRQNMEGAFGADFSNVRIHTGGESAELNNSVQARAFTTGSDIFFNEGQYNPSSTDGQELLAHELTHTVQQGAVTQAKRIEKKEE